MTNNKTIYLIKTNYKLNKYNIHLIIIRVRILITDYKIITFRIKIKLILLITSFIMI